MILINRNDLPEGFDYVGYRVPFVGEPVLGEDGRAVYVQRPTETPAAVLREVNSGACGLLFVWPDCVRPGTWAAMDANGEWSFYSQRPVCDDEAGMWVGEKGWTVPINRPATNAIFRIPVTPVPGERWKESLVFKKDSDEDDQGEGAAIVPPAPQPDTLNEYLERTIKEALSKRLGFPVEVEVRDEAVDIGPIENPSDALHEFGSVPHPFGESVLALGRAHGKSETIASLMESHRRQSYERLPEDLRDPDAFQEAFSKGIREAAEAIDKAIVALDQMPTRYETPQEWREAIEKGPEQFGRYSRDGLLIAAGWAEDGSPLSIEDWRALADTGYPLPDGIDLSGKRVQQAAPIYAPKPGRYETPQEWEAAVEAGYVEPDGLERQKLLYLSNRARHGEPMGLESWTKLADLGYPVPDCINLDGPAVQMADAAFCECSPECGSWCVAPSKPAECGSVTGSCPNAEPCGVFSAGPVS